MKAVILAAGFGSRLRPLTDTLPKSLIPVAGTPILERMVSNLLASGINELVVVTGYEDAKIREFISATFPNLAVEYVHNADYSTTNTGASLLLTKELVAGNDFIKFDADVVFEEKVLHDLISSEFPTCLCIDKNIRLANEEVKVQTDTEGTVVRVSKEVSPADAIGESIGIEKIGKQSVELLFSSLEELLQDPANNQAYYEAAYERMIADGHPFHTVDITGLKWVEIDSHEDLANANALFSQEQ